MTQLQVNNYVFNPQNLLGQGSTGTVYLGMFIIIQARILEMEFPSLLK